MRKIFSELVNDKLPEELFKIHIAEKVLLIIKLLVVFAEIDLSI